MEASRDVGARRAVPLPAVGTGETPVLPPVLKLRPYQHRWIDDATRFKGAVKSARIGFSFATALEAILDCLARTTTWTVLSASKAQSVEFVEQAQKIIELIGATAKAYDEPFADALGKTDITQTRMEFSNGSRLLALPANPRTARGYPGNAILDEFAHHEDSYSIWAAVTRQVALGHKLRVLSTPNGEQGKFFDLAKEFGLTDGMPPRVGARRAVPLPIRHGPWSWHWIDVNLAVREGCPIDIQEMRDLIKDDDTFNQEFLCVFLKALGAWLSMELLAAAEDDEASTTWPYMATGSGKWGVGSGEKGPDFLATFRQQADPSPDGSTSHSRSSGPLYLGIDFGRSGDRSCLWLDERLGDVSWTRAVEWQHNMPFFAPDGRDQIHWLDPYVAMADRIAMDATGLGLPVYEYFNSRYPGKVMGVNFGGSVQRMNQGDSAPRALSGLAQSVKIKTDMAVRMKQRMERRLNRIPRDPQIRSELMAIKREQTSTAVTFDAPRIEVDTAVAGGARRKVYSHAEAFWAKCMADLAAQQPSTSLAEGLHAFRERAPVWQPEARVSEF